MRTGAQRPSAQGYAHNLLRVANISTMASNGNEIPEESSQATKRLRWATQRRPGRSGSRKRVSIMDRLHHKGSIGSEKKRESGISTDLGRINENPNDDAKDEEDTDTVNTVVHAPRKIFFNTPLPAEMVDEDGNPSTHFARNKIRTAKYTPLSFLPKNIWWQFHNIANIYFLVLIILAVCILKADHFTLLIIISVLLGFRCCQSRAGCCPIDCNCCGNSYQRCDRRLQANSTG